MSFTLRKKQVPTDKGDVEISTFVCEPLEKAGFLNAFSTRLGGVSPMLHGALHLSSKHTTPENYQENLRRFLTAIDAVGWSVATAQQTHSDIRLIARPGPEQPGDALFNKQPKVLIGIKTADCLPILIGDPKTGIMAAIHAGWRGTAQRITEKTVNDLKDKFRVNPADCLVALGPVACNECYEVGPDVFQAFQKEFRDAEIFFKILSSGKFRLNVALANHHQLGTAGISPSNIFTLPHCTMHENHLFFSHRRENREQALVGRLLSVIGRNG